MKAQPGVPPFHPPTLMMYGMVKRLNSYGVSILYVFNYIRKLVSAHFYAVLEANL